MMGLCLCTRLFPSYSEQGLLSSCQLLIIVSSFVVALEHGLQGAWASVAVAHGVSNCHAWA